MESEKPKTKKMTTAKKALHRQFNGVVVSVVENKTIHVLVKSIKIHPKYKKQYMTSKKYAVHDENNIAKLEDKVVFEECRPLSKTKKWRLIKIVN